VFDRRVVVAIVIAAAVILSATVTLTSQRHLVEAQRSGETVLQPNLLAPYGINAYISEEALKHINVSAIELLGVGVSQFRFPSVPRIEDKSIIILHVDDFKNSKPVEALVKLNDATADRSKFALIILNTARDTEAVETAIDVVLELYRSRNIMPVLPLDPGSISGDKLAVPVFHKAMYSAEALAFTFNPVGVVVVETLIDFPQTLVMVAKWGGLVPHGVLPSVAVGAMFSGSAWTPIGFVGWVTVNTARAICYETTGTMYVKVDYFHASVTTPGGKTYHGFMAHVEHGAEGYRTRCCMEPCWWIFYPQTFISKTDWMSSTWPGQVLDDWGPKNVGTSFMPNAPYYEWYDMSDPAAGIAIAKHVVKLPGKYPISNLSGVIFSVESISIAFLDPDRPGGVLPMIVRHEFATAFNTGDTVTISFSARLYQTTVINH